MTFQVRHNNPARQDDIARVAATRPAPEPGRAFGNYRTATGTPGKRTPEQAAQAFTQHAATRRKVRG